MRTIYRYPLISQHYIELPKGACILSAAYWKNNISIWAEVDTKEEELCRYKIGLYGTGHSLPEDPGRLINLVVMPREGLIFHVFEQGLDILDE